MAQMKITEERLTQIKRRQWVQRWGEDYVAATFATPREAPGISTGSILKPMKLGGRQFHTLSEGETGAALLALYHDKCWDIHEQFVLFSKPRPHPLAGHPLAKGQVFKPFLGDD